MCPPTARPPSLTPAFLSRRPASARVRRLRVQVLLAPPRGCTSGRGARTDNSIPYPLSQPPVLRMATVVRTAAWTTMTMMMTMPTRTTSRPRMHQSASSSRERTPRGPQPAHNRLFKPRPGTLEQIIIGEVPSLSSHLMYALCTTPRAAVARIRVDYIHGFTTQSYHIRSDKLPLPLRSRTA